MKTLIVIFLNLAATTALFSQGRIAFNNDPPATGPDQVAIGNPAAPGEGTVGAYLGTDYTASLFYLAGSGYNQATFDASNPTWLADATFGAGSFGIPPAGLFDGGFPTLPFVGAVTVEVRAWYNVGAASYTDALTMGFNVGESAVVSGDAYASPVSPFFLDGLGTFTVHEVQPAPEPSSYIFMGFATASMLITHRAFKRNKPCF